MRPTSGNVEFKTLTTQQAQRVERLCVLLQRVNRMVITAGTMRSALMADEYATYINQLNAPQSYLDVLREQGRPDALNKYVALLKTADFTNARADAAAKRTNGYQQARKLRNQSDAQYELACEYLQEQLSVSDAGEQAVIEAWLDRPFNYGANGTISIDCVGVARVVGSTSKHCLQRYVRTSEQHAWRSERQIDALALAASELLYEPEAVNSTNNSKTSNKLRDLLAHLSPERDDY